MHLSSSHRRALKLGAALTAASLAAVVASPSPAGAAPAGHGKAEVATTILDVKLGQLLGVQILNDVGRSVSNPALGTVGGSANLTSLKITSTVAALNQTLGQHAVASPGPTPRVQTSLLDLATVPALAGLAGGTVEPILLDSTHTPASTTAHTARITDLSLLGGVAGIGVLNSSDRTGSGTAAAEATRSVVVDAVTVLKLGDLLKLLGIDLLKLPLAVLNQLVGTLGLSLTGILPNGQTDLRAYVGSLVDALDQVQGVTGPNLQPIFAGLQPLLAPLNLNAQSTVTTAIDTVQAVLKGLLQSVVDLLANASLLQVKALDLATVARATDSLGSSVATATGRLGAVKVGNLVDIQGVDVLATAGQVNSLVAQVENALDGVLGPLGLSGILELRLFEKQTQTVNEGGTIKAASQITGLRLRVNLPANIAQIVSNLHGLASPVNSVVAGLGSAATPISQLVAGVASLGQQPLALDLVKIASTAEHAIPASPVVNPPNTPGRPTSLPRTGGEAWFALSAAALGAAAFGGRRLLRRSN